MTEPTSPQPPHEGPFDVVISDEVMRQIEQLPEGAIDGLAAAIGQLREDPTGPCAHPLVPIPVDHAPGRPRTYVPATRSVSYLRAAVGEISPETVAHFDAELQQMTRPGEDGRDGQIRSFRMFIMRWVEYIAIQGDHDLARHINDSANGEELADRFGQAMRRAHSALFPDAGHEPGSELGVQTYARPGRNDYVTVCPVTQLRAEAPTQEQSQAMLRGLLLEWITG